eukprot:7773226-Lingulodinium_polyedra.AAC.1
MPTPHRWCGAELGRTFDPTGTSDRAQNTPLAPGTPSRPKLAATVSEGLCPASVSPARALPPTWT